jgi:predicted  nucleic acid-binding Zn-ribbon protein
MRMSALLTLLELQGHDVHLDQLRHRRGALPERATLAALEAEHAALDATLTRVRAERDVVAKEQKRLEADVASLSAKVKAEDTKLYSGTVTAPKELQALQDEIAALRRRIAALEDDVLVQMETAEPLDAALAEQEANAAALAGRIAEVGGALRAAEAVIDAEAAGVQAERDAAAASVPPTLLAEYESLRRRLGGVAVAKLEGSSCRGCHLQLAAVEVDRIRKLDRDDLVHCEECGRLLVR